MAGGCTTFQAQVEEAGRFDTPEIAESSGLVKSRQHPGIFWTLNDSNDRNRIFAVTGSGRLVREVKIEGAANVDWESITVDDRGYLYIGDIGNNSGSREILEVYRVPEPDPQGSEPVAVAETLRFRYPDRSLPVGRDPYHNFDAEALFWTDGDLYLLTKHRGDTRTRLFRFPEARGEVVTLVQEGSWELGHQLDPPRARLGERWLEIRTRTGFPGMATGADITPSGRYLAVLSYHAIFVFERAGPGAGEGLGTLVRRIDLDERVTLQCEAIAWDGSSLLLTSEQGVLHRVSDVLGRKIDEPATHTDE